MSFETRIWTAVGVAVLGMALVLVFFGLNLDRKLGIGQGEGATALAVEEVRSDYMEFLEERRPESWPPLDPEALTRPVDWARWEREDDDEDGVSLDAFLRAHYGVGAPVGR